MIIPIRCFSCGKEISSVYETFVEMTERLTDEEKTPEKMSEVFGKCGVKRICCKRMLIGHVDLMKEMLKY